MPSNNVMNMVDPLSMALGFLTAIALVAAYYYRRKYREEHRCYQNMIRPPMPKSTKSEAQTERERWLEIRSQILLRDHFRCQECGYFKHLEVHHIVPKSKGGGDNPENLVTLCTRCHKKVHGFHWKPQKKKHRKHGFGKHHHKNRHKKEKRYFKQHQKEFIFPHMPPKNWDEAPDEQKKKRREEIYQLWAHNELNQPN